MSERKLITVVFLVKITRKSFETRVLDFFFFFFFSFTSFYNFAKTYSRAIHMAGAFEKGRKIWNRPRQHGSVEDAKFLEGEKSMA